MAIVGRSAMLVCVLCVCLLASLFVCLFVCLYIYNRRRQQTMVFGFGHFL